MMGINHAGFAAALWTVIAELAGFPIDDIIVGTVVAVGAGVAPDLDEPQSSAARSLGYAGRAGLGAARKIGGYQHRGPQTHSFLSAAAIGALVAAAVTAGNQTVLIVIVAAFTLLGFGVLGGRKHRGRGVIIGVASAAAAAYFISEYTTISWWLPAAAATGWAAHVAGDMIVGSSGVPAFWPIHRDRVALGIMRVGGVTETTIVGPAIYIAWAAAAAYAFGFDLPNVRDLPGLLPG